MNRTARWSIAILLGLLVPNLQAAPVPGLAAGPSDRPQITLFRDFLASGRPCPACPEMATLPGGRFLLGSPAGEGHSDEQGSDGRPVPVRITRGLAMSVTAVTRREFAAFAESNPGIKTLESCGGLVAGAFRARAGDWQQPGFTQADDHPVVCVSWENARRYTEWLSRITGQRYRLPSEAEWEYAARAGSRERFWWGEAMLPDRVNCLHRWCDSRYPATAPVRAFRANPFGLFAMLGNVWEWTADCYRADAYRRYAVAYPAAVSGDMGCKRVIRGGSWAENYWSLRVSNREGWPGGRPLNDIGFRVVREGRRLPL